MFANELEGFTLLLIMINLFSYNEKETALAQTTPMKTNFACLPQRNSY